MDRSPADVRCPTTPVLLCTDDSELSPARGAGAALRSPVAFDIPMKSPLRADASTPGKARLEAYQQKSPFGYTDLVSPSRAVATPNTPSRQLRKEEMAEKAREANAKKKEVAEKTKAELEQASEAKRLGIERDLEEKQVRREQKLTATSSPKGKGVNVSLFREKEAQAAQELKSKLEEDITIKQRKHQEAVADRGAKAGQHNEVVASKRWEVLQKRVQELQKNEGALEAAIEAHVQKAEEKLSERKQKASSTFEHAREVAQRQKSSEQSQTEAKKQQLEGDLEKKDEKRKGAIAGLVARAGQHNETVASKCAGLQQHAAEEPQRKGASLDADLEAHMQKAGAQVASRSERASSHNEKVMERMKGVQQQLEERKQELLSKWSQKKGSKVQGDFFSRVEKDSPTATKENKMTLDDSPNSATANERSPLISKAAAGTARGAGCNTTVAAPAPTVTTTSPGGCFEAMSKGGCQIM